MSRMVQLSPPLRAVRRGGQSRRVSPSCQHPVRRKGSLRDAATVADGTAAASLCSARPPGSVSSLGLHPSLDATGVPAGRQM
jgi:hypothetical protein